MTDACATAPVPSVRTGGRTASPAIIQTPVHPSCRPCLEDAVFYVGLAQLRTPEQCASYFCNAVSDFGFEAFTCGEFDPSEHDRTLVYIGCGPSNRPHARPGSLRRDPIMQELARRAGAFTWSDLRADTRPSVAVRCALNSAAAAGWHDGLLIPIPHPSGRIGFVSLVSRRASPGVWERQEMVLMSLHLHHHVRTLVCRHGFAVQPLGLTDREIEVTRLAALGRSDAAIGRDLGIAASTAHEYIEKAKRKVKVRSRTELAALAVSLGIIAL